MLPSGLVLTLVTLLATVAALESKTQLHTAYTRVFSRQKRFVLFPKGSNLKFTGSISKGLMSAFPKGVGMSIDQALYYPVPTSRADVYPKRFRARTTTTAAPKTTTAPSYVWIPGTDWRFKAKPVPPAKPVKLHQRIDMGYAQPSKWAKWSKYAQKYENWTPATRYYDKQWTTKSPYYYDKQAWNKWTTVSPNWSKHGKRWYRAAELEQDNWKHVENWQHYHGQRDRRQLFEHFGGFSQLLGFNTKACIMRAICDSKRLLLPPGYSMLQDIIRLIFTMPTTTGIEDDYSRAMKLEAAQCAAQFRQQCPLNLLAWLMGITWH